MKTLLKALLAAGVAAGALLSAVPAFAADRPNIIVILFDDMGFSDIGCYGGEIPTPNIDALAADGLRFTQFYNNARCSPSRAALLTGLNPHQAGMGYLAGTNIEGSKGTLSRLHERAVTIPQVLHGAGYFTAMTGKWHLGMGEYTKAFERGFDHSLMLPGGGIYFKDQDKSAEHGHDVYLDGEKMDIADPRIGEDYWYGSDLYTRWGERFFDAGVASGKPVFLYLSYVAPHFPLMAPDEDIARFRGKYSQGWDALRQARYARQQDMNLIGPNKGMAPLLPDLPKWDALTPAEQKRFDTMMAVYAAAVSRLDKSVGDLVTHLKKTGHYNDTLIMIMSDNGGNAESGPWGRDVGANPGGPHSNVWAGMGWASLENAPFAYFKHFTREGGIATPLIVHWPAGMDAGLNGSLQRDPSHFIDIMPTLVDISGAKYPEAYEGHQILPMEGISLLPALHGDALQRDKPLFWAHEGNRAVRDGRWKAVMKYKGVWELYDMDVDRTETQDVAVSHPDRVKAMSAAWDAWAARTDVDMWQGPARTNWGAPPNKAKADLARGDRIKAGTVETIEAEVE
jgi:arylsulfatase